MFLKRNRRSDSLTVAKEVVIELLDTVVVVVNSFISFSSLFTVATIGWLYLVYGKMRKVVSDRNDSLLRR